MTETLGDDRGLAALGKVKILSSLSDADMEALYRRADLVALPTRGEGWGRPHVEAMASVLGRSARRTPPQLAGLFFDLGRVHFGAEGGAPNGNMAPCLGGGLKALELQLHSN